MTGIVKYFNPGRGFGHILAHDNGPDIFFHQDDLEAGVTLRKGQEVDVSLIPNWPSGPDGKPRRRALAIRLLEKISYVPISDGRNRKAAAYGD